MWKFYPLGRFRLDATFASRTWRSLDEGELKAFFWEGHSYPVPETFVALFPVLLRASLEGSNERFNSMVAIDTLIDGGRRLEALRLRLD